MLPRPLLLVATSLAAALALCPLRQGYQNLTLTHGGLARRALVFAPTASPASPPALFALHGVTTTAEDLAQASGLDAVAAANAFLLVFPDGLDASWNAVVGLAHAMPLTQMDIAGQVWGFFSRYTRSTAGQGSEIESSSSSAAVAPVKSSSAAARSSSAALRSSHGSHASEASVSVTPVVCLVLALVAVLLC
eukprot:m51a1_g4765 hypothetical protein (192) ;mRNA; f:7049-10905